MPEGTTRNTGPLRPIEVATAAVMATIAAILTVAGWFLPHFAIISAFAVVPLGVVAHHTRLRALLAATFAASTLSFLVAGTGSVSNVIECAAVGGLIGIVKRRDWGYKAIVAGVLIIGPVFSASSVGLLYLFGSLRKLVLTQIKDAWISVRHILLVIPGVNKAVPPLNTFVLNSLKDWWVTVAVVVFALTVWFTLLGLVFLGSVLQRLEWIKTDDRLDIEPDPEGLEPAPVPATLTKVGFRYPRVDHDAVVDVDLDLQPGEMVALVGNNGSGKSTLVRLLAGRAPTRGSIDRMGGPGLGRAGGTALIMQQPETQVLGVRVADDVVWGLADADDVDIEELLRSVGLQGFAARETSGLSGGELQRLAVAAALARRPQLLLSDESTAMIDEAGRTELVELLRALPSRGTTVVHVTHRPEEAEVADRQHRMHAGRMVDHAPQADAGVVAAEKPAGPKDDRPKEKLVLAGVSHTYGVGTPWANEALAEVNLTVEPGEGLLIVGGNGSGKSTLAWIMAGLLRPSYGTCRLGDDPVHTRIGSVGLAFQHARLQLQRATVLKDLLAAGAQDDDEAKADLRAVGLDPDVLGERRIDALSGGQQRRVALAGILARRPSILVLDEPMAGLDAPSRESLLDLLTELRRDHGIAVVIISHDLHGMERVCERTVRLDGGRIVADAPTAAAGR